MQSNYVSKLLYSKDSGIVMCHEKHKERISGAVEYWQVMDNIWGARWGVCGSAISFSDCGEDHIDNGNKNNKALCMLCILSLCSLNVMECCMCVLNIWKFVAVLLPVSTSIAQSVLPLLRYLLTPAVSWAELENGPVGSVLYPDQQYS